MECEMAGTTTQATAGSTAADIDAKEQRTRCPPGTRQPPRRGLRGRRALSGPDRVARACDRARRPPRPRGSASSIETVEADVALAISVLRFANRGGMTAGGVAGVPDAVDVLKPSGVLAIAGTAPSFDFFESNGGWELKPERFRVHALATQRAADQIGRAVGWTERDELAAAALLHDIGRLVISRLHPGYKVYFDAASRTPEQRLRDEREQLGIDHALVGGVLARRWNLPQRLAVAIERHHAEDAEGLAAMVAVADMVAHYTNGEAISPDRLTRGRRADRPRPGGAPRPPLRAAAGDAPRRAGSASHARSRPASSTSSGTSPRAWSTSRSPTEMHLSVSTIRTHLHNVYGKIGAVDRAQAVLTARDRGWI